MTGESGPVRHRRAGIEQVQKYVLPFGHADGFTVPKHPVVDGGIVIRGVHRSVSSAGHVRVPIMQGEEELLIVVAGIALRLQVKAAKLSGIEPPLEIVSGKTMRVIPAESRRPRREFVNKRSHREESLANPVPWSHPFRRS